MLYYVLDTDALGEEFVHSILPLLSDQRAEQLKDYRGTMSRVNCSLSYLLLRYALKKEYGICSKPEFRFGERGKPYLSDRNDIFFNISHGRNAVACMISDAETAADIMDLRKVNDMTMRRCCSDAEQETIMLSDDPSRTFTRLWTRKECYSKLLGKGLILDFRKITDDIPEMQNIRTTDLGSVIISFYSVNDTEQIRIDDVRIITDYLE